MRMLYSCATPEFIAAPVSVHFPPSLGRCPGHPLWEESLTHIERTTLWWASGVQRSQPEITCTAALSSLTTLRSLHKVPFVQKEDNATKSLAVTRSDYICIAHRESCASRMKTLEGLPCLLGCELRLYLGAVICYSLKSSFHNLNEGRKYLWFLSRNKCLQNIQKVLYHFTYSAWSTEPKRAQRRRCTRNLATLQSPMMLYISKSSDVVHIDFTCYPN